jgi:flavin reductase (DIM6/NTAB) family NADH-FMN oxidoreductase RutF
MSISSETFKTVMRRHAASVVVVSLRTADRVHGMTATAFTAVSATPPLVLFCVNTSNETHALLEVGQTIGVSVLADHQEQLSQRFASKGPERYECDDIGLIEAPDGAPLMSNACAAMEVVLRERHWGGDHSIFVAEVTWAEANNELAPLVYHAGAYTRIGLQCPSSSTSADTMATK